MMQEISDEAAQQARAFDAIGARYEAVFGTNATQSASLDWLSARLPPGARVLDLGCGTGRPTAERLVRAGHAVTGVDISEGMLRIAREKVPGATFLQADMAAVDFPEGAFDAITSFFAMLMLRRSDIDRLLVKLHGWLSPRGYLVFSMVEGDFDYVRMTFLDQPVYLSAYPAAALAERLQVAGFTILEQHAPVFVPAEGAPAETQLFFFCQRA